MNDVQPSSASAVFERDKDRVLAGISLSNSTARFADVLEEMLDRTNGDRSAVRPYGAGTMRSTVDVFDANGFFDGSVPAVHQDVPAIDSERGEPVGPLAAGSPPPAMVRRSIAQAQPESSTIEGGPTRRPITDVSDPAVAPAIGSSAAPAKSLGTVAGLSPLPTLPRAARTSVAEGASSIERAPATKSRASAITPTASAAMRLAITRSDDCVAVMVDTHSVAIEDEDALRDAVGGLLARHGLRLSELRITRRSTADAQQRGNK